MSDVDLKKHNSYAKCIVQMALTLKQFTTTAKSLIVLSMKWPPPIKTKSNLSVFWNAESGKILDNIIFFNGLFVF
ncbi:hypothetical protein BPIT_30910 [Candidatus Brocadia pituitae]|nr:hypothetical protein BPIT_30910 [Candidatus Brocadia pituitae]